MKASMFREKYDPGKLSAEQAFKSSMTKLSRKKWIKVRQGTFCHKKG